MTLPALTDVLRYEHSRVLKLYEQNYPNNALKAEIAFKEVLKYLWLAKKHEQDRRTFPDCETLPEQCVMLRSMREIDEMWHEFILFTEDYTVFCHHYFGEYIHHMPNIFDSMPITREKEDEEIRKLLPYILEQLGEETMRIWFREYLE